MQIKDVPTGSLVHYYGRVYKVVRIENTFFIVGDYPDRGSPLDPDTEVEFFLPPDQYD